MKLYLSSYRIPHPEKLFDLIGKDPAAMRGVIITNAKERRTEQERDQKTKNLQNDLAAIGLTNTVAVDVRKNELSLAGIDYVFAAGGNTFALRQAMIDTGFDAKIKTYLENGGVYVGESAGAIVAGPSLRGFERMDNYFDGAPFDGAGLVDVIIVPHSDSPDPAFNGRWPMIQEANPDRTVQPLNDDEDFIVNE